MAEVSKATARVIFQDVDITADISKYLISMSYTDNVHGKADEVELQLDDKDGLFKDEWYPDKKATLKVEIICEGETLDCGTFYVGEITITGPPDTVTIHGTSIDPNSDIRTKRSKGYNKQTLLKIAQDIAKAHNLTLDDGTKTITLPLPDTTVEQNKLVVLARLFLDASKETNSTLFYTTISNLCQQLLKVIISIEGKGYGEEGGELRTAVGELLLDKNGETAVMDDVRKKRLGASKMSELITNTKTDLRTAPAQQTKTLGLGLQKIMVERSTQNNETDLEYLKRISNLYGFAFNIKPPYMIFYSIFHLEAAPSVATIDKSALISYSITDKTHETYSDVDVSSHNPFENETITNATELQNTSEEQVKLQSLIGMMQTAALTNNYGQRVAYIRKAGENNDSVLKGLSKKGFGEEYDILIAAYSLLYADKSVEACVRYSNVCKDLKQKLIKIQAKGNKVTKDKDAYAGGQSSSKLVMRVKAENQDQANAIGKAALHRKNSETKTGSITMPGKLLMTAGNNFTLTGFGRFDDQFTIKSSVHNVAEEYTVSVDFKLGPIVIKVSKKGKVSVK